MPCKWIIAPHKVDKDAITQLEKSLPIQQQNGLHLIQAKMLQNQF